MKEKTAIQIHHLSFGFPGQPSLFRELNLSIPEGSTFGILGPNGTGKSTLIKIMLGLMTFREGKLEVLGKQMDRHRAEILRQIGFLLEGPRLYAHLSGRENLKVFAAYRQIPLRQLEQTLEMVGLTEHSQKLVRHYSTGMKQRLAIAVALLHQPKLLILDEPTNGLDPQGIAEIRQLVLDLKKQAGRTIIFCSHILNEVQQICDHVGILHQGRFVFQGPQGQINMDKLVYLFETDQPQKTKKILANYSSQAVSIQNQGIQIILNHPQEVNTIIDELRRADISIFQIKRQEEELESIYLRLIEAG